jgi:ketosteroid isomerase-like protein
MSDHPNIDTVNRMTQAIVEQDREALSTLYTGDMQFHLRGPFERAGDHVGADGVIDALGHLFEVTNGDIKLEQLFITATDEWVVEWERSLLGRKGKSLESHNAFVYRFDGGRIAEMWMFLGANPEQGTAFFA